MPRFVIVAVLLLCGNAEARLEAKMEVNARKNPIRKVVNMLQAMSAKVTAEKEKKEELFDKFMCYCKTGAAELGTSIAAAESKIPQVESAIKEAEALKLQLVADLKSAKTERAAATASIDKATSIRDKENAAYSATAADLKANIAALSKAIPVIESGMAGSFLQTAGASTLRKLSVSMDMNDADRDLLTNFLEEGDTDSYAPKSGEIVGILKQMKDEMEKDLKDAMTEEDTALAEYESLVAAKKKEIASLTAQIEEKSVRSGETAVEIANMKNDLEDTEEQLAEDKALSGNIEKECADKKVAWDEYSKASALEVAAIADTIKFLNDDDALELFKKTLPGASSFMQIQVSTKAMRQRALQGLRSKGRAADSRLDFIQMALHGGKMGFDKIIVMIDELIGTLNKEQGTDDAKVAYCTKELESLADEAKSLSEAISGIEKDIDNYDEMLATLTAELEALKTSIEENDKRVAEATSARKEEHEDYVETLASNKAAKEILGMAKNRLNKFYNPNLYKAPPKVEAAAAASFVQVHAVSKLEPAPEADLTYKKKSGASSGVIAMITTLVDDLEKENMELEAAETQGQKEYEEFMAQAAEERQVTSKAITDKAASKADTETALQKSKEALKSKKTAAMENAKLTSGMHGECDWLLKYYETRKEARTDEIESLDKAKAVLSGADYSLLQSGHAVHLRGARHVVAASHF
mmetsp:Transcript_137807/g.242978  ORF Transcript_137807/g.242978 Transcript_137807/m.242978 type:complete len:699 (-) Transcript_137807:62-2158(-)